MMQKVWRTAAVLAMGSTAITACGSDGGSGTTLTRASTVSVPVLPVSPQGGLNVVARATVRGKPYLFTVDTGAQRTTIDPKVVKAMGLKTTGKPQESSSVCSVSTQPVALSNWQIGGRTLPPVTALSTKTAGGGVRQGGATFAGSLGADVLARFGTVTIDARRRTMTLGATPEGGSTVPLRITTPNGSVAALLPVTVNGRGTTFVLDTGAGKTIVDPKLSKRFDFKKTGKTKTDKTAFCTKTTQTPVRISGLELGSVRAPAVPAISSRQDILRRSGGEVIGLIGLDVVARYGPATIDFKHAKLTLGGRLR